MTTTGTTSTLNFPRRAQLVEGMIFMLARPMTPKDFTTIEGIAANLIFEEADAKRIAAATFNIPNCARLRALLKRNTLRRF